jgi:hypothetical protein
MQEITSFELNDKLLPLLLFSETFDVRSEKLLCSFIQGARIQVHTLSIVLHACQIEA